MKERVPSNQFAMDTSAEAEAIYFDLLRKKTPVERLQMLSSINVTVRNLMLAGLKQRHPNDDELEIKVKLAKILHGEHFASVLLSKLIKEKFDE